MSNEQLKLKKFEDYEENMPMQDILTFAKIGFICAQLLKNENMPDIIREMIKCDIPG